MKEAKILAEAQFDKLFTEKPVLEYCFNIKKMGNKDRKIIKCLMDYGIKGKKCLDVGPGTGRWLQFLRSNGASYLGAIDISQVSLNRCSLLCDKTQKANLETDNYDFDSNYFDIVISIEVMEHLRDPSNYLSETVRVVKKGGIVLMSMPNIVSFISRLRTFFGFLPVAIASDKTHVRFYRKKDVVRLFNNYKLNPIFIPTSISLYPLNPKSKFSIPSFNIISSLDDSLLFLIRIENE